MDSSAPTSTPKADKPEKKPRGSSSGGNASGSGGPKVTAIQRRPASSSKKEPSPAKNAKSESESGADKPLHGGSAKKLVESPLDQLKAQLAVEENETDFTSAENGKRAMAAVTLALAHQPSNEALLKSMKSIVLTWISKGEDIWIDAINMPSLFDISLEVANSASGKVTIRTVREKLVKAYISRLRAARNTIEWSRWLSTSLGKGDITLTDVRPHLVPLLELLISLIPRSRLAITQASKSSGHRKLSELWAAHSAISIDVCNLITRSPHGLGPLCSAESSSVLNILMGSPSPSNVLELDSPGTFALRVAAFVTLGNDPAFAEHESKLSPNWLTDSGLSSEAKQQISFSELESWMEMCAFAFGICSSRSKAVSHALSLAAPLMNFVFREYGEAYAREFPTAQARRNCPPIGLVDALDALRGMHEFTVVADVLMALQHRYFLFEHVLVADSYHRVCTGLAEVGLQLIAEQCIRYGSLLMTHSWGLFEGDSVERMTLYDLDWICNSAVIKMFHDGRLMLRIAQACAWPFFCQPIAEKVLKLARIVVRSAIASGVSPESTSPIWIKIQSVLSTRFKKSIHLFAPPASGKPIGSLLSTTMQMPQWLADAASALAKHPNVDGLVPTFARKEFNNNSNASQQSIDPAHRMARAKRFADAVLGVLEAKEVSGSSTSSSSLAWLESSTEMFWECLLECDMKDDERLLGGGDDKEWDGQPHQIDDTTKVKSLEDLHAWLCAWACRGLVVTTLRSRFGSAKDTFQQLEAALERKRQDKTFSFDDAIGSTRFILNLLWNLHREIIVCSVVHPDTRISAFFVKNADTCQSWLLRLADLSLSVEQQMQVSGGRGLNSSSAIFYFLQYDDQLIPKTWTRPVLETLAKFRDTSSIRSMACRSDMFASTSSKTWADAFALFSTGAYSLAADKFNEALKLLEDELEGVDKTTEDELERRKSSKRFHFESLLRLGEWRQAKTSPYLAESSGDEVTKTSAYSKFLEVMITLDETTAAPSSNIADSLRPKSLLSSLSSSSSPQQQQQEEWMNPLLAFAKWCAEPSSTSVAANLRTACARARMAGWSEVEDLASFIRRGGNSANTLGGQSASGVTTSTIRDEDDALWIALDAARTRFGLPIDHERLSLMCLRALEAGHPDLDAARSLLKRFGTRAKALRMTEEAVDVRLRLALEMRKHAFPEEHVRLIVPSDSLEMKILELMDETSSMASPHTVTSLMQSFAIATGMTAAADTTASASSRAAMPRYLFALGEQARRVGDNEMAARIHLRHLQLGGNTSSDGLALRSLLLYLDETDDRANDASRAQELASLPLEVLVQALPHLLARSETSNSVGSALEELARQAPRELVWGIVANEASATTERARRAIDQNLLGEAERLKAALVEAARTFDEDWDDFLDELQKKPWLTRVLASLVRTSSSSEPTTTTILTQVRQLWRDTFGATEEEGEMMSPYHSRFLKSDAGLAIKAWVDDPADSAKFAQARAALAQWLVLQGSRRQFADVCRSSALTDVDAACFSVIPGEADAGFRIESRVDILRTKTRPRKLGFKIVSAATVGLGSDAASKSTAKSRKSFLLKSAEDLRLDQRLVQLWSMIGSSENVRSYLIVPLSRRVGLIEWVDHSVPMFHAYREWKDMSSVINRSLAGATAAHLEVEKGERLEVTEQFQQALLRTEHKSDRLAAFREVRASVDAKLLKRFLWTTSRDPDSWWRRSRRFASSCGATSALGWIVGLGDRHLDNILIDIESGQVVHVDLNVCFDKGLRLRVPETVPFRLTGIMTGAMPFGDRKPNLEQGPFGQAMLQTIKEVRSKKQEILSFLTSFVFDPVRPQSATSRVGLLDLDRTEFESLRTVFITEAKEWLSSTAVQEFRDMMDGDDDTAAGGDDSVEDVSERLSGMMSSSSNEVENPRLILERARASANRALADCSRRKEAVAGALDRVLGSSERILKRATESSGAAVSVASEVDDAAAKSAFENLSKAELLCSQVASQALARCVQSIRKFNKLAKLGVKCVEWNDRLGDALKKTAKNERVVAPSLGENEGNRVFSDVDKSDIGSLESFKIVVQSIVESSSSSIPAVAVGKSQKSSSTIVAAAAAWAPKLEKAQKRVEDMISLVDSILLIAKEAADECVNATEAFRALKRASDRTRQTGVRPVRKQMCESAPDCSDFLHVCYQLRMKLDILPLARYQELRTSSGIAPQSLGLAMRVLEEGVRNAEAMIWTAHDNQQDKAELQAKQANGRVKARMGDDVEPQKLVNQLIDQATNEKNLSEMWIGWMAFL